MLLTLEAHVQVAIGMLQTGSSLGTGDVAVAKDAADETTAHAQDAAQQVCFTDLEGSSCSVLH